MTVLAYMFSPNYFHREKMQCGRTEVLVMRRGQANCFSWKPPSHEEGDMGQPSPQGAHHSSLRDLGGYKGKLSAMSGSLRVRSLRSI